jgi:hypothetical protein
VSRDSRMGVLAEVCVVTGKSRVLDLRADPFRLNSLGLLLAIFADKEYVGGNSVAGTSSGIYAHTRLSNVWLNGGLSGVLL